MLISIIIILIAFTYLLKETDYLRVRLYSGKVCFDGETCEWKFQDDWVTHEMKSQLIRLWSNLPKETLWRFQSGIQEPMCGWGYAWQYHDVIPECKVEMNLANVRYKFDLKNPDILKDIMKANKLTKQQKQLVWGKV
jgi:hypothetical protein